MNDLIDSFNYSIHLKRHDELKDVRIKIFSLEEIFDILDGVERDNIPLLHPPLTAMVVKIIFNIIKTEFLKRSEEYGEKEDTSGW